MTKCDDNGSDGDGDNGNGDDDDSDDRDDGRDGDDDNLNPRSFCSCSRVNISMHRVGFSCCKHSEIFSFYFVVFS